jgi:hypothetical protein
MDGFGSAQKDGANGNVAASCRFKQVVGNVGRINIGQDQQVGVSLQGAMGHLEGTDISI